MHKKTYRLIFLMMTLVIALPLFGGAAKEVSGAQETRPLVAVSILPQKYAVDMIAGDLVDTVVLVGPGQSPHSYEPTPKQMTELSRSDVWILSGTDFEMALVPKISSLYPRLMIVDGTEGVSFRYLEDHDHEEEPHAQEEPDSLQIDRHTWLGREPMKILATHIARMLASLDETHAATYLENLQMFHGRIDQVFDSLATDLRTLRGTTVFVYHPSFGYLLDEFGIIQEAVETGGKEPTAKALAELIRNAQDHDVRAIFVQAQFPTSAARNVAQAIGAQVLPLDPLAYDWMENIHLIGRTLLDTFVGKTGEQP